MKMTRMFSIIFCSLCGVLDGCATGHSSSLPSTHQASATTEVTTELRPSDRMFYWCEEARELREMAKHREREAELVLKKYPGPGMDQFIQHMRLLAHQLEEAADYAGGHMKWNGRFHLA